MPLSIERNNFKTGLFLEEAEFKLEQQYHSLLRRKLNFGLFEKAGILIGLDLIYDGVSGTVTVQPGVALVRDITTQEARELLVTSSATVPVTGASGSPQRIVLSYVEVNGADKLPVSPARIQEVADIRVGTPAPPAPPSNPELNVVLGQITVGAALAGSAPERQLAIVRSSLLGASVPAPGLTVGSVSGSAGGTVTLAVVATGSFTLTSLAAGDIIIVGAPAITVSGVSAVTATTADVALAVASGITGTRTITITRGGVTVSATFTIPAGLSVGNFVGVDEPAGRLFSALTGTGFASPLQIEFSAGGGAFTSPVAIPSGGVTAAEIRIPSIGPGSLVPVAAVRGPVRITVPGNPSLVTGVNFVPPPVILTVSPTPRARGLLLNITGNNFHMPVGVGEVAFEPFNPGSSRGPASVPSFPAAALGESQALGTLAVQIPSGANTGLQRIRVRAEGGIVIAPAGQAVNVT